MKPALQTTDLVRLMETTWVRRAILVINLLLLAWIFWSLADLTRSLFSEAKFDEIVPLEPETQATPVEVDTVNRLITQLPDWHLFGEALQEATVTVRPSLQQDAPETRLQMELRGVFAADQPAHSRAIIADPAGREEMYAIGDRLADNAELSEVHTDRVILLRGGRYESLRLLREDQAGSIILARKSSSPPVAPPVPETSATNSIASEQKQASKTLSQLVNIQRKKNAAGQDIGYILHPGSDPELFVKVGLHDGDELIRINDITADTAAGLWRGLQSGKSGTSVTMQVLRDNRKETIVFRLPE